jgi:hypothetical protein
MSDVAPYTRDMIGYGHTPLGQDQAGGLYRLYVAGGQALGRPHRRCLVCHPPIPQVLPTAVPQVKPGGTFATLSAANFSARPSASHSGHDEV